MYASMVQDLDDTDVAYFCLDKQCLSHGIIEASSRSYLVITLSYRFRKNKYNIS
jgi:hypothetical protein